MHLLNNYIYIYDIREVSYSFKFKYKTCIRICVFVCYKKWLYILYICVACYVV